MLPEIQRHVIKCDTCCSKIFLISLTINHYEASSPRVSSVTPPGNKDAAVPTAALA